MRWLSARPLVLAGPAAVLGVLAGAGAAAALLLVLPARRFAPAWLAAAALVAGVAAGAAQRQRTERALAACARAPPARGRCRLVVDRAGEDPFGDRAWLQGRRADGVGVLCSWPGTLPAGAGRGAVVHVTGRFFAPRGPTNPGEDDARARLAARGISLLARLRDASNLDIVRAAPRGLAWRLERARVLGARRLRDRLPPDVAPVAAALVLGVRSGVSFEDRLLFERTGTLHVLAISGMHLLLLAGLLHGGLRRAGCGPRLAAGATLAAALLYLPVAGGAPPIRRATTVLVFYALALVRGRPPDVASALSGAAAFLALTDPADVGRVGFRLSFAATAGIALLAPAWRRRWGARTRLLARFPAVRRDRPLRLLAAGYVASALPVSLAAWCATQPLVAQAFGLVTPLAPLTNVAAGPFLLLLLPAAAALTLGAEALAPAVTVLGRGLRRLLAGAEALPAGCLSVAPLPAAAVAGCLLAAALLRWRPAAAAAALAAGLLLAFRPAAPEPRLFLFDVGHGQAALVRFADGATVLVDGGSRGRRDVGRRVLLPALRALRVARLDTVVCTHADADHWNGLPDVVARLPVGRLVVGADPPPALLAFAARFRVPVVRARAGAALHGGRLRVLAETAAGSRNDRSLALLIEVGGRRVLLPADREEVGLRDLLAAGAPACDVLVAPHHGARCGFAARFGRDVAPRWLLVSAARSFAHRPTLEAYGAAHILETATLGCLVVELDGFAVRPFDRGATIRPP